MIVQKRMRGGRAYFYLVQSYREGRSIRKLERYLGPTVPADLSRIRESFLLEVFDREYGGPARTLGRAYRDLSHRTPLAVRRKNLAGFATQFTYDTDRIEGSALTFRDTASLLEDGRTPANRPLTDVLEALAHREVFFRALAERGPLTRSMVLDWHRRLFARTKPEIAGKVRSYPVRIAQSRFVPPEPFELDRMLTEFFDWSRASGRSVPPVVRAALVHLRLVTIHPFGDGNGRLARIAMNRELRRSGFPPFNIPYARRRSYYTALERSQMGQDEVPFVLWFARRYLSRSHGNVAV